MWPWKRPVCTERPDSLNRPSARLKIGSASSGGGGGDGLRETGAPPTACISVKGELTDNQKLGPGVQGRAIELSFFVGEDSEVDGLVSYVGGILIGVLTGDTDENNKPRSYAAKLFVPDEDRSSGDPLDQGAQGSVA